MHWMQSLVKKNNLRRRKSQSPNSSDSSPRSPRLFFVSKHKRQAFRKDSGLTELESISSLASSSTEHTDTAPWRVAKFRSGPPRQDEWWENVPAEEQHCGFETPGLLNFSPSPTEKRFRNCGLETWLKTREVWNRRTVETLPPRPTPAEHNHLVRGLKKASTQRTYQLPRRMALSDLIEVYTGIWDGDL